MEKNIGVALVGAAGRMGLEIVRAAISESGVRVVSAIERPGSPARGQDIGDLAEIGSSGVLVVDSLEEGIDVKGVDVLIDLSMPGATSAVIKAARAARKPLVCGTTGLPAEAMQAFQSAALDIPVLYTPNLSLGIAVTRQLMELAIGALGAEYDVEIVEMHHRNKGDSPSGTAVVLAQCAAQAKGFSEENAFAYGRFGSVGARPRNEIGVHAVRGGGVFGEHTIILAGEHDQIEITHRASSRSLFAKGAMKAARFLHDKPAGFYTMAQMLFPSS